MAQFIFRKSAQNDTGYVEIVASDGDALTADEALIVMLKNLDTSVENMISVMQQSRS